MNLLQIFAQVGEGMGNSILIFVLTLLFSLPLGLLVAFGAEKKTGRRCCKSWPAFARCS